MGLSAQRTRKEPKTFRSSRRSRIQPSRYFCEIRATMHRFESTFEGSELSINRHSSIDEPERAIGKVLTIQEFPAKDLSCHQLVWTRYRYRASQHRFQLRYARGLRYLFAQSCKSR